jgi:hypothetical protein
MRPKLPHVPPVIRRQSIPSQPERVRACAVIVRGTGGASPPTLDMKRFLNRRNATEGVTEACDQQRLSQTTS